MRVDDNGVRLQTMIMASVYRQSLHTLSRHAIMTRYKRQERFTMFWENENVKLEKGCAFHFYGDSALFFQENPEKRRRSGSV